MDKHPDFHGGEYSDLAPGVRAAVYPAVLKPKKRPGIAAKIAAWAIAVAISWLVVLGVVYVLYVATRGVLRTMGLV